MAYQVNAQQKETYLIMFLSVIKLNIAIIHLDIIVCNIC